MSKYYLALDIGGTKTTSGLFTESGELLDNFAYTAKSQTFKGEEAVYQNTRSVLDTVLDHFSVTMEDIEAIGVGSPGPLKAEEGIIVHAPLMGWHNFPIVKRLKEDYGRPVYLDNDGNLGALAEAKCGVAKDLDNVLYMTVSTGCGGGLVINGKIYHGAHDAAAEVGHMCIDPEGLDCPCGAKGCFELYASGTAVNRRLLEDLKAGVKNSVFESIGYDPERIEGKILTEWAAKGDPYALSSFRKEGYYLGIGISNLLNLYDPDVIVLGGGLTKGKAFFHEEMMRVIKERCLAPVTDDTVRYSLLNDRVVLYGTYWLVREKLKR